MLIINADTGDSVHVEGEIDLSSNHPSMVDIVRQVFGYNACGFILSNDAKFFVSNYGYWEAVSQIELYKPEVQKALIKQASACFVESKSFGSVQITKRVANELLSKEPLLRWHPEQKHAVIC